MHTPNPSDKPAPVVTDPSADAANRSASPSANEPANDADVGRAPRCIAFYAGDNYIWGDSVAHRLFVVMSSLRREVDARMSTLGLTDTQWKPIWLLSRDGGGTAQALCRELDSDGGAMTRTLDRLEAKGLIERVRSESDRRVVQLQLTPAGKAVAAQIPQLLATINNEYLRGFSHDEWSGLKGLLDRMIANGQALNQTPADAAAPQPQNPKEAA